MIRLNVYRVITLERIKTKDHDTIEYSDIGHVLSIRALSISLTTKDTFYDEEIYHGLNRAIRVKRCFC